MLDVHVRPHRGPTLGEVTRGLEDPHRRERSLIDYVNLWHQPDPTPQALGTWTKRALGTAQVSFRLDANVSAGKSHTLVRDDEREECRTVSGERS